MSKPENQGPPEQYYNEDEARKYSTNSRIRKVQYELSQRAYELLELPRKKGQCLLLDIGCGSGLSGEVLTENGHEWIGCDISRNMLDVAKKENEVDGGLLQLDMGGGLPFRAGVFDGAISVSAIQWLCHSNSKKEDPRKRLLKFFESLFACLSRSARAVFQFYPENQKQCDLISQQALKAGFQGGLVIDHPDSPKQRKVFLVLSAGKEAAIVQHPPMKKKYKRDEQIDEDEEWNKNNQQQSSQIQIIGRNEAKDNGKGRRKMKLKSVEKVIDKNRRRRERRMAKAAKKREGRNGGMKDEDEEDDEMEI